MKNNYLRGSYFAKLMSCSKGGESPSGGNAKLLGELLNLSSEDRVAEMMKIVHGIFLLGRHKRLYQLNEQRRGGPQYHFMFAFIILSEDSDFMKWAMSFFMRKYKQISFDNYTLWALFALVYPQLTSSSGPVMKHVMEYAYKTDDTFLKSMLDSAIACAHETVSFEKHKDTVRKYTLPTETSYTSITAQEIGLGGRNL